MIHHPKIPPLSSVRLKIETFKVVETLKRFSHLHLIDSPRLKLAERRGKDIISYLFRTLAETGELLPQDWRDLYEGIDEPSWRSRVVCDYIAGMTDRYCVEVYSRLTGANPMTIWKPH